MERKNKSFWISVPLHEGDDLSIAKDLKELLRIVRMDYIGDTQKVLSTNMGYDENTVKKFEEMEGKPHVGLSTLNKLCKAYNLKCELKIYRQ